MSAHGIDVSYYQGAIDWERVKPQIDFAIIRCGYGSNLVSQDDPYFHENAHACTRLGIPFGTYLYSYANSLEKARSEARHVLRMVKGHLLEYPLYYDIEDPIMLSLDPQQLTDIVIAFCEVIEEAGYFVGIYADRNTFTNLLQMKRLTAYDKWLAEWRDAPSLKPPVIGMWQYSDSGQIDGIDGDVDLNIAYRDYPQIIRRAGLNGFKDHQITYIVQSGDSLWKIAEKYLGGGHLYPQIKSWNALSNDQLVPGQKLILFV